MIRVLFFLEGQQQQNASKEAARKKE